MVDFLDVVTCVLSKTAKQNCWLLDPTGVVEERVGLGVMVVMFE